MTRLPSQAQTNVFKLSSLPLTYTALLCLYVDVECLYQYHQVIYNIKNTLKIFEISPKAENIIKCHHGHITLIFFVDFQVMKNRFLSVFHQHCHVLFWLILLSALVSISMEIRYNKMFSVTHSQTG